MGWEWRSPLSSSHEANASKPRIAEALPIDSGIESLAKGQSTCELSQDTPMAGASAVGG